MCYDQVGNVVEPNYTEAVKWYRKAAEQGNVDGQINLAILYENNNNFEEAAQWYRILAEQGNMYAQEFLGVFYEEGKGVEQDFFSSSKMVYGSRRTRKYKWPVLFG